MVIDAVTEVVVAIAVALFVGKRDLICFHFFYLALLELAEGGQTFPQS